MRTVVTIGNFDGVHLGHAALVRRAREIADTGGSGEGGGSGGGRVVAMTFFPHPAAVLRPSVCPPMVIPFEDRVRFLRHAGADEVVRLDPASGVLAVHAREFVAEVCRHYKPIAFVEGSDFHFGKGRDGNIAVLTQLGREMGFDVSVVDPVEVPLADGSVVVASSTITRWLIANGRVADAAHVLGRPVELTGRVAQGDQKGRLIGFPTANLELDPMWAGCVLPQDGVYIGEAVLPGSLGTRPAMLNIGNRPTVGGMQRRVEAHLLGLPTKDPPHAWTPITGLPEYGWTLTLRLTGYLRDQVKFPSFPDLARQLERDRERAITLTSPTNRPSPQPV